MVSTKLVGIYKITSPSGNVYIGQSWDIKKRWATHRRDCKNLAKSRIKSSIHKYGHHSHIFEIIHPLPKDVSQSDLNNYEELYIDLYSSCLNKKMLNITKGGLGSKGIKMPETTRNAIYKSTKGKKQSEEFRKNASIKSLGNSNGRGNKGKIRTQENRLKISESLKIRTDNKHEHHPMARFNWSIINEVRSKYIPRIYTTSMLSKEYGMSKTNVKDILNYKIWVKRG